MFGRITAVFVGITLSGCGEDANYNSFFVDGEQYEAVDVVMARAEQFYNSGNHDEALAAVEKANKRNPNTEDILLLKSYIHLSLANVDIFKIVSNLNSLSSGRACAGESTSTIDSDAKGVDAANSLSQLQCLVGLGVDEIRDHLTPAGNQVTIDGKQVSGISQLEIFSEYPLYLPLPAMQARASASLVLSNLNKSIESICPFVNIEAKLLSEDSADNRHVACPRFSGTRYAQVKSHFIWVMAHLIEALAFRSVVLYMPKSTTTPSLLARSRVLENQSDAPVDVVTYVDAIKELSDVIEIVLPTDKTAAADSMLAAMFNDLAIVQAGLGQISGVPSSLTDDLLAAIESLSRQRETIVSIDENKNKNAGSSALKQQLISNLVKNMEVQIRTRAQAGEFEDGQFAESCTAYESIADEALDICAG